MKLFSATLLSALFLAVTLPVAAQMEMLKPGPELKKLDVFAGTWRMTGEIKPGAMGPGGTMTETESCKWMEGDYFLVCQDDFKSSMGNGTGVAYMGYDPNQKMYTYDSFNSMGEAEHSKGRVEDDTWTWSSEEKMGDKSVQAHFIIKVSSPSSYTFKFDMSPDGSTWNSVMEGKATKE